MADAVIGALRVELGADSARLEDGLKQAQNALSSFARNITNIAAGIGLEKIIEKSVSEAVFFVKDGFERIDKIGKEAQKAGIGVEAFSGLVLSAELADVSMEQLGVSLGKLSKNMVDTSKGTGEAQATFQALGISVTDSNGKLKDAGTVLTEIAGKFANSADGAGKTAAAIALLGRSGKDLIPLLNAGADGLEEMRKTAENMGLVISENTAASVEHFNDNLKILAKTKEGIVNLVIQGVIPALVRLSDQFVENAKDGSFIQQAAGFVITEFKGLVVATYELVAAFTGLVQIGEAIKTLWDTRNTELFNTALTNLQTLVKQFPQTLQDARDAANGLFSTLTVEGKKGVEDIDTGISKFTETINNLKLRTAELRLGVVGLADGFLQQAVQLKLMNAEQALAITNADQLNGKQAQLNQAMLNFQGARVANEAIGPWENYQKQIERVQKALQATGLTAEETQKLQVRAAQLSGEAYAMSAEKSLDGWVNALKTMGQKNKELAIAYKAVAITQALINTYLGATKAYAELGPFGFVAAAGIIAAGLAQVALIAGLQFAKGGSFQVGGGMTGLDSQLVAFRATPGEVVDVRRPGQPGAGGQAMTVNLNLPSPGNIFSDHIREMVTALNKAAPDGYVLKVPTA